MSQCPSCNAENACVLFLTVQCVRQDCMYYSPEWETEALGRGSLNCFYDKIAEEFNISRNFAIEAYWELHRAPASKVLREHDRFVNFVVGSKRLQTVELNKIAAEMDAPTSSPASVSWHNMFCDMCFSLVENWGFSLVDTGQYDEKFRETIRRNGFGNIPPGEAARMLDLINANIDLFPKVRHG